MKETIIKNKAFLIPYSVLLLVSIFFIVHNTKAEIHLFINHYHNPVADIFFKYITYMGDGITLPLFLLVMAMFRYRYALLLALVFVLSGLFVQILKRSMFADIVRPSEFFKGVADLYLVPGEVQNCCRSFPSGHSATAFGLMICFSFVLKNNWLKFGTLIFACLVAYSRMYLSQHFLIDITVGSLIGILIAFLLERVVFSIKPGWLDNNLLDFLRKKLV